MSSTYATSGPAVPDGYIFDDSGLPENVKYLGDISISGANDAPFIIAGDPNRLEFGRVPLSAVATVNGFSANNIPNVINAPSTATASAYPGVDQISFGYNESASTLTVFVKTVGGTSLSGVLLVGRVASATAWTNILGVVK